MTAPGLLVGSSVAVSGWLEAVGRRVQYLCVTLDSVLKLHLIARVETKTTVCVYHVLRNSWTCCRPFV